MPRCLRSEIDFMSALLLVPSRRGEGVAIGTSEPAANSRRGVMRAKILHGCVAASLLFFVATSTHSQTLTNSQNTECLTQLHNQTTPKLVNQSLASKTKQLCYSEFVLLHSGVTRTPLWSAEHLTAARINTANAQIRPNPGPFHAEKRLPKADRSELDDYKNSGFDRGHMSPNGDMSTEDSQIESFSLANMIPQHPCHNEVLWEGIESAVRDLAIDQGEVFVVTGPAFIGDNVESLDERVLIPTHVFKAIFIPARNAAEAYWTPNDGSQRFDPVSIARLQEVIGIDVFPSLGATVKQASMELPRPTPHHQCRLHNN
jgi:endonuclease G